MRYCLVQYISDKMIRFVGPPEVPKKFARLPDSETISSIGFTWFPGFHGGADQIFHIEYKSEGHEWKEGARLFGGKVLNQQLQTKVDGLASGSSYVFRIYASNEYGNSIEKSNELFGSTVKVAEGEFQCCISVVWYFRHIQTSKRDDNFEFEVQKYFEDNEPLHPFYQRH